MADNSRYDTQQDRSSAQERTKQDAGFDSRIAPQTPRGQEAGAPSCVNSAPSAARKRLGRIAAAVLVILVLAIACACGVYACTVGAQDPSPISSGQLATGADGAADEGSTAEADGSDAAAAGEGEAGDSAAQSGSGKDAKGAAKGKGKKDATGKGSESGSKDEGSAAGDSGSKQSSASSSSSSGSFSSAKKDNAGKGNGGSGKDNAATSNKITVTMSIDGSRAGDQDSASMSARKISVKRGANVYDVLVASGVAITGDAVYVSSISGLAEFQCGGGSGWMYSVDGVFPNVSCGKYTLKGGEKIVWAYTLDVGEDLK